MEATVLVRKESRKKERHTSDVKIEQAPEVVEDRDHQDIAILAKQLRIDIVKHPSLTKDYLEELAFMEEPLIVRFSSGLDPHAPKFVDCSVNGKGIEVLMDNGKWFELFQVPVNRNITMKRKYVEVFARCKHVYLTAKHEMQGEDVINKSVPNADFKHPFSIIDDKSPRGDEWFNRVASMRAA